MPRRRHKQKLPTNILSINVKVRPYVGDCRRCQLILMESDWRGTGYLCPRCDTMTAKNNLVKHTKPHEVDMVGWSEDAKERHEDEKQVYAHVDDPGSFGIHVGREDGDDQRV
jgi:hypothetical protein